MFKRKRKILFASEASFANTGFATIYKEIVSRVHASGKFRIAEFATDTQINNPADKDIKWRFYANGVAQNDPRAAEYDSMKANHHGAWRFDKVLLDFEPDIVVDLRDPPFFEHENLSPLRQYFHWCIGPTVDSAPQYPEWIDMFLCADSVIPYTKYGYDVLKKTHPDIKCHDHIYAGINLETFRPQNKSAIRRKYNIDVNKKIIGYISRNQIRKKFPELFKAFKIYLDKTGSYDTYLHCHTSFPDSHPWNIPRLLLENDIANNVLFTYYCKICKSTFLEKWQGSCTECKACKKRTAIHPKTGFGCSQETMSEIHNLYDLYIQYSSCEGLGFGMLEAAACGVPVMAVDYSAMNSLNTELDGIRIPYNLSRDIHVDAERANPDVEKTAELLVEWLEKPKEILYQKGVRTRALCEKKYSWDSIVDKWIDFLENIKLENMQGKWGHAPMSGFIVNNNKGSLEKFRNKLINTGRTDLVNSYIERDLYYKQNLHRDDMVVSGMSEKQIDNYMDWLKTNYDKYMSINLGKNILDDEDFIRYADIKEAVTL